MFETICFLIGAIGIVLAIPVSGFFTFMFLGDVRRRYKKIILEKEGGEEDK